MVRGPSRAVRGPKPEATACNVREPGYLSARCYVPAGPGAAPGLHLLPVLGENGFVETQLLRHPLLGEKAVLVGRFL